MKFKHSFLTLPLFLSFAAQADIPIKQEDILGAWSIDAESIHRDGSTSKKLLTTWTFNADGTMIGESKDSQRHARIGEFRATLKYRVENGKLIRQSAPGRTKEESCTAIEKEGKKMILKCKSIYYFMTKK